MKVVTFILCFIYFGRFYLNELFYVPKGWPEPVYNFKGNELSEEKVLLGRALFYDPILSGDSTISCASCHSPFSAFTHTDHDLSHGIHDRVGMRNSPVLVNLAWHPYFMWDGAINHLDVQPLAPISHPDEMDSSIKDVVTKLSFSKRYKNMFYKAFKDSTITSEKVLKSISQFMVTLISANSKYDKVMRSEDTFTSQEQNGYEIFKKHCSSCHKEPLFTNFEFANNGLPADTTLNDMGRRKITSNMDDDLKFKIPTLRNIEYSYPYMHDGRFKRLSQVIQHYTKGIQISSTLAPQLKKPIDISSNEKVDLISFLLTLSDKEFIFNSNYQFPDELKSP